MIKLFAILLTLVPQLIPAPAEMQVRDGVFTATEKNQVKYVLDSKAKIPAEGYTIDITRTRAKVVASTEAGLFYARQTLSQLEADGTIPCVKIKDYPRFRWRGFMVDAARHFFGKAAEFGIEGDIRPPARLAVKERPRWD